MSSARCSTTLPATRDKYRLLADQLEIYNAHGARWSIWAYKDMGREGVVSAAPDSPWTRRIQPVLDKKQRLGLDV